MLTNLLFMYFFHDMILLPGISVVRLSLIVRTIEQTCNNMRKVFSDKWLLKKLNNISESIDLRVIYYNYNHNIEYENILL